MAQKKRQVSLIHPGEILNEEFLQPLGITINSLAMDLHVPSNRIYAIVEGARSITPDTALRLAHYFGTSPEFWINLQAHYDLESTRNETQEEIERVVRPRPKAA